MIPSAIYAAAVENPRLRAWATPRCTDIAQAVVEALGASVMEPFSLWLPRGEVVCVPSIACVVAMRGRSIVMRKTAASALLDIAEPSERPTVLRLLKQHGWAKPPKGSDPLPVWTQDGIVDAVGRLGDLGFWTPNRPTAPPVVWVAIPFRDTAPRVYVADGSLFLAEGPVAVADMLPDPPDPLGFRRDTRPLEAAMNAASHPIVYEDEDAVGFKVREYGEIEADEDGLWSLRPWRDRY